MKPTSRNRFGVDFLWLGLTSNHSAPLTYETCLYIWLIFPIWQDLRFQLILQRKGKKRRIQPHNRENFDRKVWMRQEKSAWQWIEIGNARHSWGSDSYLTTSSDVHVVSWAAWSSGCILGLPTFEANVVYLPTDLNRESAQDFAFQYAYAQFLSQQVNQQKLEPSALELNSVFSVLQRYYQFSSSAGKSPTEQYQRDLQTRGSRRICSEKFRKSRRVQSWSSTHDLGEK